MRWFLIVNVFALILLTSLQIFLKPEKEKRAREYTQDMMNSFAFQTQSENPFLPKGQTQQPLVQGVIPFQKKVDLLGVKNSARPNITEKGHKLYAVYCQVCHGVSGEGDGPVTRKGFPPPPSLKADNAKKLSDEQLYDIISNGIKNMPSYQSQILPKDRYAIIQYVRQLQEK